MVYCIVYTVYTYLYKLFQCNNKRHNRCLNNIMYCCCTKIRTRHLRLCMTSLYLTVGIVWWLHQTTQFFFVLDNVHSKKMLTKIWKCLIGAHRSSILWVCVSRHMSAARKPINPILHYIIISLYCCPSPSAFQGVGLPPPSRFNFLKSTRGTLYAHARRRLTHLHSIRLT